MVLKIVGLSHGKVEDEKILLDEDGKLTLSGVVFIAVAVLAVIGILSITSKIIKVFR